MSSSHFKHVFLVLTFSVFAASCRQQKVQTKSGPPPVPVGIAKATQESVPVELRAVGRVEASATIQVKSQVAGQILRVHFTEGQTVQKGAPMFDIDDRPYREALRQAEAAVLRDRAQLKQAEATLARDSAQSKNAEAEAQRYTELSRAGVISKAQYDQVRTSADVYRESVRATQASMEGIGASLQSDLAAVERAKLDISYCQIRAPITGRTGSLLVHAGNLVRANGDAALVIMHQIAPVYVSFSLPEQHLSEVRRLSARQKLTVHAVPQGEDKRAADGFVSLVDNAVDSSTGTITLKASFINRDGLLWPGQFANVTLRLDTIRNATVVPAEAVQAGAQGSFVYRVKSDGTVEPRVVSPGRTHERRTVIEQGINPGDTVVTDGHLRLMPGAHIQAVEPPKL